MKRKAALVLSGGGARGIAHIGVIEALEKRDFEITSVAGTSMGALIGGVYALGKMEAFKNWLFDLDKISILKLVDFSFSRQGLIKGERVLDTIKEFTSDSDIEDLGIPYTAVAVDILNQKEVVFTQGSLFNAIRASISIPTVLTPVPTENGLLIDGGVLNNLPLSHIQRTPDQLLIAVNVNANVPVYHYPIPTKAETTKQVTFMDRFNELFSTEEEKSPSDRQEQEMGYFDLINKTIELMTSHNVQLALKKFPPDILINSAREIASIFDFHRSQELVEIGRHIATEALDRYEDQQRRNTSQVH